MDIEGCHPAWPDHADFKCPCCNGRLVDCTPGDYYELAGQRDADPKYDGPCPECGELITVVKRITVKYTATAKPASGRDGA